MEYITMMHLTFVAKKSRAGKLSRSREIVFLLLGAQAY